MRIIQRKIVSIMLYAGLITVLFFNGSILAMDTCQIIKNNNDYDSFPSSTLDLPETFDLRDVNGKDMVTSVKSQIGGTCWAHGVMAAMESNLLITDIWNLVGESGEPNLAEYHLDWWNGFNSFNNDDISGSLGLTVHYGGDYRVASAYLSRGDGAVRDKDGQSFDEPSLRSDPSYHYYYPREIEWYTAGDQHEHIDIIKDALMTHGAIGTCVMAFNLDENWTHYYDGSQDPNHAVTIIGWDDHKQTEAELPGAWLVKNSWGIGWGLDGYFWLSYYDVHAGHHPEMGAVSFQDVEPFSYNHIYYHDYHGWRDTKNSVHEAFNKFIAVKNHNLTAVSFFTAEDNVDYSIRVYDDFNETGLSDELLYQEGSIMYTGFHTIDLSNPIMLSRNDDFYIYVNLSHGGHPYDKTSKVPVLLGSTMLGTIVPSTASPDQSYFKNDFGKWIDLTEYDETANFCIKGLVGKQSDLVVQHGIMLHDVQPGSTQHVNFTVENHGAAWSKLKWEMTEMPSWGEWSFNVEENNKGLYPEEKGQVVETTIKIPDEEEQTFDGVITIKNSENPLDVEKVTISISTQENNADNARTLYTKILQMMDYFKDLLFLFN